MNSAGELKISAYYISQYFWMLYVIIPLLISLLIPYKTNKMAIISSMDHFNSSKDPVVFAHLTDIHINRLTPASVTSFQTTVSLLKNYSPDFVVVSGDITDNYEPPKNPRYGDEIEENWMIYKREISNISEIPIIEVAGNHDQFGVKGIFSHKNYIIDYSRTYNRNNTFSEADYACRTFTAGRSQTNIITINPYEFPTGHPPLLFFMKYSTQLLDRLTSEIQKNPKSIIISHYPVGTIHSETSSQGSKFSDIIGTSKQVLAYLTGHTHPNKPEFYHQGKGNLEVIGPSNYYASQFGLVTLDNDMITWTTVNISNPPNGIISYPTPKGQISPHSIFNDIENSEIRVIMFTNRTDLKIKFTITNTETLKEVFTGYLQYKKTLVENRQILYTFPMKECVREYGPYNLTFSEDFKSSIEFFEGNLIVTGNEVMPTFYNARDMVFVTFPIFFLILFIITFVSPFETNGSSSSFETIENWIETSTGDSGHWFIVYLLGFLLVRTRFQRTPLLLRLFVFLSVVYGIIGPLLLFETEDLTGYISAYGYYINNKAYSSDFGTFFAYFYLLLVCLPMIVMCSSLSVKKWTKKQDGDLIFTLAATIGNLLVMIEFIWECVGQKHALSSIGYVGVPTVFSIMFVYYFFAAKEKKKDDDNDDSSEVNDYLTSNTNIIII